jgi:hypothetical protein
MNLLIFIFINIIRYAFSFAGLPLQSVLLQVKSMSMVAVSQFADNPDVISARETRNSLTQDDFSTWHDRKHQNLKVKFMCTRLIGFSKISGFRFFITQRMTRNALI